MIFLVLPPYAVFLDCSFNYAARRLFDERQDKVSFGTLGQLGLSVLQGLRRVVQRAVYEPVNVLNGVDLFACKASAIEADAVDSAVLDRFASSDDVGRDVFVDLASALDHYVCADMAELMHQCTSADDGVVLHHHFARQLDGVAHDDMVVQEAIVCYVAVCHDEAVIAHDSLALAGGAAMHGCALTDSGVVADNSEGFFALELEVLRNSTHYGRRVEAL